MPPAICSVRARRTASSLRSERTVTRADARAVEEHRPRDADVLRIDPRAVVRQRARRVAVLRARVRREQRALAVVNRRAGDLRLRAQRRERGLRALPVVERDGRRRVLADDAGQRVDVVQHLVAKRDAVVRSQRADGQQQRCQTRQHEAGHQLAADREIAKTGHVGVIVVC